jgi:hypothetical protein
MNYFIGVIFLLVGIWQLAMTWRTFARLKTKGDKSTSPFIMLGLWTSFSFSIIFLAVALGCFFGQF